jgi:hypothetical protein
MKNNFLNIIAGLAVTGMVAAGCNSTDRNSNESDTTGQSETYNNGMPADGSVSDTAGVNNQSDQSGVGRTGSGEETGTGTGRTGTGGTGGGVDTATSNQNNF